jgi:hypothetical protein
MQASDKYVCGLTNIEHGSDGDNASVDIMRYACICSIYLIVLSGK